MKKPRRDRARWLEGAPEYVAACRADPKYAVRYTIFVTGELAMEPKLGASEEYERRLEEAEEYMAITASGASHWGELERGNRRNCGKTVRWLDLPEEVRHAVVREYNTIRAREAKA